MSANSPLLTTSTPTTSVPAAIHIGHVQLRELIVCPRERGVVNYVQNRSIVEHNIHDPSSEPHQLVDLSFVPNTIASLPVAGTDDILLAAGGQEAEIHLSLHPPSPVPSSSSSPPSRPYSHSRQSSFSTPATLWKYETQLVGTINNSIHLTSLNLTPSHESSVEPKVVISNNDCTVKFYDISMRGASPGRTKEVGCLRLDVPVNHSSISPDGRTLLSVGDSSRVNLHSISGGARLTFNPVSTLTMPTPKYPPSMSFQSLAYTSPESALAASFSTSFSNDGTKFAVASQEGVVVVWDVRSSKPLKVFESDKTRGSASGSWTTWPPNDSWDRPRFRVHAPGWGFRSVKFSPPGSGKELMVFTEHTSLVHVVDGRTFETEEIIRMPNVRGHGPSSSSTTQSRTHSSLVRAILHAQPRAVRPRARIVMTSQPPPPPRVVLALEDTFRIPVTSSPRRRSEGEDVVLIPSLGDRIAEDGVHALLGRRGIGPSLTFTGNAFYPDGDNEMEDGRGREEREGDLNMELDELEPDCLSSQTPSRAGSPAPSLNHPHSVPHPRRTRSRGLASSARRRHTVDQEEEQDQDLAGVCFSPSGEWLYVGGVDAVAEWGIRGAEKRWWGTAAWA